jgi:Uma2 family endonuclease
MKTAVRPPRFDAAYRFTVDDYYRLVDAGILPEARTTELLDGQVIPLTRRGPEAQWIVDHLNAAFVQQRDERFTVSPLCPLVIPSYDVPEPDLVLHRPGVGRHEHVITSSALLVIEIDDGAPRRTLRYKAGIYRRAGVPEYWVVDLRRRCLHAFTLAGKRYRQRQVQQGRLAPASLPGVEIDVDALFGEDDPDVARCDAAAGQGFARLDQEERETEPPCLNPS